MNTPLRTRPLVVHVPDFLTPAEAETLRAALTPDALADWGAALEPGESGATCELEASAHPLLEDVAARLQALVGLDNELEPYFRVRVSGPGQGHPLHTDDYQIGGARLWVTALVYLNAAPGGETVFPNAEPPLRVQPTPGAALVWVNQDADGRPDLAAEHLAEPPTEGERVTLAWFTYASRDAVAAAWAAAREASPRPALGWLEEAPGAHLTGPPFYCLDDGVPVETVEYLRAACADRGLPFEVLDPALVDGRRPPLEPGSILFSPATSWTAERVEQQLWQPGVRSFHRRPEGPFVQTLNPLLAFARAGLPVPRFAWITSGDRDALRALVDDLGGLPLVLKAEPGEGGVGTLRVDSYPALMSVVDLIRSRGTTPMALSYVPDAMHLRLIVVGDEVVAAYRNPLKADDFRSEPSYDPADYDIEVEPDWAEVAVEASRVVGYAFAGVDLLLHPSGRVYLLEANFPCYYAQAMELGVTDVAGAMVDYLMSLSGAVD